MNNYLISALNLYCKDPEDWNSNLALAKEYHSIGQTASAVSFYLRAAERVKSFNMEYYCLLKIAECFHSQGNRENTIKGLYLHAIETLPNRREAYYLLSKLYEAQGKYVDSYTVANLGLRFGKEDPIKFDDLGYPGQYGLIFQKAVSAWWWGKPQESRDLFKLLADNYVTQLDHIHYKAVQDNLLRLGIGEESQAFKYYTKDKADRFLYKFDGLETIENNFSQVYQDMFVLAITRGKKHGSYLEIGSAGPYHGNNTALLEKNFSWNGIGIEYNKDFIPEYEANRSNPVLCVNALQVDYNEILSTLSKNEPGVVDYLQLDCEPSSVTYQIMERIPFDKYKFRVITYEHDDYVDMEKCYRYKSREFLKLKGYVLVVNDVSPDGKSNFEDWWVHPDLVDPQIIEAMKTKGTSITKIEDYMLR